MRNAIAGDDGPRPIVSVMTMDKHRVIFGGSNYLEHLLNYLVTREAKIRHRDAVITKPQPQRFVSFGAGLGGVMAEIDYRFNSDLFQCL